MGKRKGSRTSVSEGRAARRIVRAKTTESVQTICIEDALDIDDPLDSSLTANGLDSATHDLISKLMREDLDGSAVESALMGADSATQMLIGAIVQEEGGFELQVSSMQETDVSGKRETDGSGKRGDVRTRATAPTGERYSSSHSPGPVPLNSHDLTREAYVERISAAPETEFDCVVCGERLPIDSVFYCSRSFHTTCWECTATYATSQLSEKTFPLRCPHSSANEPCHLTEADALILLSTEPLEQFYDCSIKHAIMSAKNIAQCMQPDCEGVAELDEGSVLFACPICLKEQCVECKVEWHEGLNCAQYVKWRGSSGNSDSSVIRYLNQKKAQKCPKCGNAVEKSTGCQHMHCRCGCHFCYGCGEKFPRENHTELPNLTPSDQQMIGKKCWSVERPRKRC